MVAQAAAAVPAAVYVGGAALFAGAVWLMTPAGQTASQTLGQAMAEGGANAIDNIVSLFTAEDAPAAPVATTTTDSPTRTCDGPHRGRLQVQGYMPRIDPAPIELSWPWSRPCIPPLRPEGLGALSAYLLPATAAIAYRSAGYRGPVFAAMSQYISKSPPMGFMPANSGGWSISGGGVAVRNFSRGVGRNAPRVDLDIFVGRAFGDR